MSEEHARGRRHHRVRRVTRTHNADEAAVAASVSGNRSADQWGVGAAAAAGRPMTCQRAARAAGRRRGSRGVRRPVSRPPVRATERPRYPGDTHERARPHRYGPPRDRRAKRSERLREFSATTATAGLQHPPQGVRHHSCPAAPPPPPPHPRPHHGTITTARK